MSHSEHLVGFEVPLLQRDSLTLFCNTFSIQTVRYIWKNI